MTVFTYHEPLPGFNDQPVLDLWKQSWSSHGWTPVVLGREDAQKHPDFEQFLAAVTALPSVNPKAYEVACFLRWLAMTAQGGGLMTDYDVMNASFTPSRLTGIPPFTLRMFEPCGVPSAVAGDAETFASVVDLFRHYQPDSLDLHGSRPHVSDQNILARHVSSLASTRSRPFIECPRLCVQWSDNGWREAPLLHFANAATKGRKLDVLREWLAAQGK